MQCWRVKKRPTKQEWCGIELVIKHGSHRDQPFLVFCSEGAAAPLALALRGQYLVSGIKNRISSVPCVECFSYKAMMLGERAAAESCITTRKPTLQCLVCDGPNTAAISTNHHTALHLSSRTHTLILHFLMQVLQSGILSAYGTISFSAGCTHWVSCMGKLGCIP